MPATGSFDKGAAIEEWTDLRFFRPLGLRIARAMPTRVTPDQITGMSLVIGLIAGNLFYYHSVALNALGVALFVVSDIFDSADGQLARMRGSSTKLGKILDGISDGARFSNLYLTLIARMIAEGSPWWLVLPLGVAAGVAHARQSAVVDQIRQLYLYFAEAGRGELALTDDADMNTARNATERAKLWFYRRYLAANQRVLPTSTRLVRETRDRGSVGDIQLPWTRLQTPVVRQCAWIGQNIRFALLAVTVVPQHPAWYLVITLVPMTIVRQVLVTVHERHARLLLGEHDAGLVEAMS